MERRKKEDRGADNSVEVDLILNAIEAIQNSITKIEERLTSIEKILETK